MKDGGPFVKVAGVKEFCDAIVPRKPYSDKRDNGRVLIIGGSGTYHGAPVLASSSAYTTIAALRAGAGYAVTCVPEGIAGAVRTLSPNVIVKGLSGRFISGSDYRQLEREMHRADSVVIGPGIGSRNETTEVVLRLAKLCCRMKVPLVLDAEAIGAVKGLGLKCRGNIVITPHDREFRRLSGTEPPLMDVTERARLAKEAAAGLGICVLLKGHRTIVTDGDRCFVTRPRSAALATMGTGDVLSGIIGGLAARNKDVFASAVAGAFVHARVGDALYGKLGNHAIAVDALRQLSAEMARLDGRCGKT